MSTQDNTKADLEFEAKIITQMNQDYLVAMRLFKMLLWVDLLPPANIASITYQVENFANIKARNAITKRNRDNYFKRNI